MLSFESVGLRGTTIVNAASLRKSSGDGASLALRVLRSPLAASRELCCCAAHDGVGREAALCCWRERLLSCKT